MESSGSGMRWVNSGEIHGWGVTQTTSVRREREGVTQGLVVHARRVTVMHRACRHVECHVIRKYDVIEFWHHDHDVIASSFWWGWWFDNVDTKPECQKRNCFVAKYFHLVFYFLQKTVWSYWLWAHMNFTV